VGCINPCQKFGVGTRESTLDGAIFQVDVKAESLLARRIAHLDHERHGNKPVTAMRKYGKELVLILGRDCLYAFSIPEKRVFNLCRLPEVMAKLVPGPAGELFLSSEQRLYVLPAADIKLLCEARGLTQVR